MRPSDAIVHYRGALLDIASRYRFANLRVFGSAARGEDREGSDIDLLVDAPDGTTLLTLVRAKREAEDLTGVSVDIHTIDAIHERYRANVMRDARPL
ncbi:MAG TPA: nucleotidyltransferase family protein [Telmatospirillum sp.]|nr:nucleotidyltransferase family protein [Telmatospirillum sp.]